jgi:putative transposase
MPAKFRTKIYQPQSYYHIYNRGIDQRTLFLDNQDYSEFTGILKKYLLPVSSETRVGFKHLKPSLQKHIQNMNLSTDVKLIAYCLMPNHFHLLVYQNSSQGITQLMRRICTQYSMYFNKKYKRTGNLFESVYRAVLISALEKLPQLTKYIHQNPLAKAIRRFGIVEVTGVSPEEYPYSSLRAYLTADTDSLVDTATIKDQLGKRTYKEFFYQDSKDWINQISDITIDQIL